MGKRRKNHKSRKSKKIQEDYISDLYFDMDGTFAYIAGYTPGGAPYGVTWEEVGIDADLPFDEKERLYMKLMGEPAEALETDNDDELPFY